MINWLCSTAAVVGGQAEANAKKGAVAAADFDAKCAVGQEGTFCFRAQAADGRNTPATYSQEYGASRSQTPRPSLRTKWFLSNADRFWVRPA